MDENKSVGSAGVHQPVLADDALDMLSVRAGGVYVDGTLGSGGHAELILGRLGSAGKLLGIDRDGDALDRCCNRLAAWKGQCMFERGNLADMARIAREKRGIASVDGILLDLGLSSEQIETAGRGFSFSREGPLDMRMDKQDCVTAADIVNGSGEEEIEEIIRVFGEDRAARRIAREIVKERTRAPITSTTRLAEIVARAAGQGRRRIHPATRTFQALRIAVNRELTSLEQGLEGGLSLLHEGGRMVVISFHSLEDRLVKDFFRRHAGAWQSQQGGGSVWRGEEPRMRILTRKPMRPSFMEMEINPRSRSAKLRAAEKAADSE